MARLFCTVLAFSLLAVSAASAAGDPTVGAIVFKSQCSACHAVDGHNRVGPHLNGVVGRKAGTVPGYSYSVADRESGLTWTEEELMAYLDDPRKVVPGTKMPYTGLHDARERSDLVAYLETLTK